jgi:hypothetical protein
LIKFQWRAQLIDGGDGKHEEGKATMKKEEIGTKKQAAATLPPG